MIGIDLLQIHIVEGTFHIEKDIQDKFLYSQIAFRVSDHVVKALSTDRTIIYAFWLLFIDVLFRLSRMPISLSKGFGINDER